MSTTDITIIFVINEDGEYDVGTDREEARERFDDGIGSPLDEAFTYTLELTGVPLPDTKGCTVRLDFAKALETGGATVTIKASS